MTVIKKASVPYVASLEEKKEIEDALFYLENHVMFSGGSIYDLQERIQEVRHQIYDHLRIAVGVHYPIYIDNRTCTHPHHFYNRFGPIGFFVYTMVLVDEYTTAHSSHHVFWKLYKSVCEDYYHFVLGLSSSPSAEYAVDRLKKARQKLSDISPVSLTEMVEHIYHNPIGDFFMGGSAAAIAAHTHYKTKASIATIEISGSVMCEKKIIASPHFENERMTISSVETEVCDIVDLKCTNVSTQGLISTDTLSSLTELAKYVITTQYRDGDMLHNVVSETVNNRSYLLAITDSITSPGSEYIARFLQQPK